MAFGAAARALALLAASCGPGAADADVGYELLVTSAGPDVERTCFPVPGLQPPELGAFFQGGPAKFEMGGYKFQSFFDGYGRMNRFELREGAVCYTARYMNTSYYNEAELLGRPAGTMFMGTDPKLPRCPLNHPLCGLTGLGWDNNWVNLLPMANGGEGFLLTDSPVFVRFDYETMGCHGTHKWSESEGGFVPKWMKPMHMPATGSAHPVRRPKTTSTYVEVMLEVGLTQYLAVYTIETGAMRRELLAHVPMKGAQYFHSFGVTEHYVVLPCNLRLGASLTMSMIHSFGDGWDGIHVVDLEGKVQIFDTEKFFHAHIANTFENETGIVMDLGTFGKLPFSVHTVESSQFVNRTERDIWQETRTERLHLHLAGPKKGQVTRQLLGPRRRGQDFFKINHNVWGLPYCVFYGVEWFHDDEHYASMAIFKNDVCRGKVTYWHRQYAYPGEPYFLPRGTGTSPEEEDDGWLFFVSLNGTRRASDFVILDGKTFSEVAAIELPVHIPFLAHGQFVPQAGREAVTAALEVEHPELAAAVAEASVMV